LIGKAVKYFLYPLVFVGFLPLSLDAQANLLLSRDAIYDINKTINEVKCDIHSSVKPYQNTILLDSGFNRVSFSILKKTSKLKLLPHISLLGGYQENVNYNAMAGFSLNSNFNKKLGFGLDVIYQNQDPVNYVGDHILMSGVVPGIGYVDTTNNMFTSWNWGGYLSYSPNRIFNFQLGKGKNFFGDGYRSLLLSDNTRNYPYAKISTTIWKIKYVNLYSAFSDVVNTNGDPELFKRKYATTHYLSWKINSKINLSLFETIVWQAKDTLLNRGYDVNYLNPVIFFRPVEFGLGSADNALMGLNTKIKLSDRNAFYGQFIIDEFLLNNFRADLLHIIKPKDSTLNFGWWANKYGFQVGYQHSDFLKKGLDIQSEINIVRPFTYSHSTVLQSYGHFNQPLAHPWGANFKEWVNIVRYQTPKFIFQNKLIAGVYGTDSSATNYGKDIFKPYTTRATEYYHFTGQGLKNTIFHNHFSVKYKGFNFLQLNPEIGYIFRIQKNSERKQLTHYIYFGLRTNLPNFYNDY